MSAKNYISGIYKQYHDELHRFLFARLHCKEEAADVVQEVFARLLSLGEQYEIRHPRGFLYRAALNLSVDGFRARRSKPEEKVDMSAQEELSAHQPGPDSEIYSRQRLRILQQAIEELPPKCREVFLLHKFDCHSHAEIAARLGISRNMVEKHVIKAISHCRARLEELE